MHFESVCYHPLLLFNQHGDCLAAKLRPGNVHSAEDWDELLLPEIERQQAAGKQVTLRAMRPLLSWRFMSLRRNAECSTPFVSNLFNHPNFLFPASNISVPGNVGVISSVPGFFHPEKAGARLIEMRIRLDW